ncbi:hypothetical protein [Curtobacterium herbarum]|uniref:XRE family transcriptional regulator n=1 Tax=Curtobacterium herbarum TaxID=150122 RepID=A0ABP4K9P2_9MICO|nr:hypothetical protein [Curtobacterium herbarum]MBM7476711.1 hypothetical protein [Curtobacterium herbarum]MCS6546172.1 hypothetical protein [Curtobacterium herbarum]
MSHEKLTEAQQTQRAELARKLHLLCSTITAPDGGAVTYPKIRDWLADRDVKLSRSRWEYMRLGNRYVVDDERLLRAIAEYFEIDPTYLTGPESQLTETIDAALRFTLAERTSPVSLYAARTLNQDVTAEHLDRLTALLREIEEARGRS